MKAYQLLESQGLPAAPEAERMLLAAVILDSDCFSPLAELLERNDFSLHTNRLIWDAVTNLHESGDGIDTVSLCHELDRSKSLEAAGGIAGICAITDGIPQTIHPETYARIVQQKSILRQAIQVLHTGIERCLMGSEAPEVLEFAQRTLAKLSEASAKDRTLKSAAEIIDALGEQQFLQPQLEIATKANRGVPVPFPSLEKIVSSFRPGQLIIVAARPGIGKSAAAGQIAYHAAANGIVTAVFSLEMENREILHRIVCGLAEVNGHAIKRGILPDKARRLEMLRRGAEVHDLKLFMDEQTGCTVASVSAAVRRLRGTEDVGLVVIDYLQLMETTKNRQNRNEEVSEITRGLKKMAREFALPVVALSQLSRDSEKASRKPILSDLRDSGSIEQDADIVIFLHPTTGRDYDNPTCEVEFIVAKHRGGPVQKCVLTFERNFTRFVDSKSERAGTQRNFQDKED